MPPLSFIKILGHIKFASKGHTLPIKYESKYHKDRYEPEMTGVPGQMPVPWFKNAAPGYKHYQEACDKRGKDFADFHDTMCDAVMFSHTMWKLKAKLKDLKVNALTGLGTPGCLDGPELESEIKNAPVCKGFTGNKAKHRDAVAKGVSKCYKDWMAKVMVPGLPWYPALVAFPGPQAPPMPNIPMPLITCPSANMTKTCMANDMAKAMSDALDGGLKDKDKDKQFESLHEAIALVLSLSFLMWLPQQMVMLVLGKGPIPTFAPPYVPVGPVVGGDIVSAPGHVAQ